MKTRNITVDSDEAKRIITYEERVYASFRKYIGEEWSLKFHAENADLQTDMSWKNFYEEMGKGVYSARPEFFDGYMYFVGVTVTQNGEMIECTKNGEIYQLSMTWNVGNIIGRRSFFSRDLPPKYCFCSREDLSKDAEMIKEISEDMALFLEVLRAPD